VPSGDLNPGPAYPPPRKPNPKRIASVEELLPYARKIVKFPERRYTHVGFAGYGDTKAGDKVMVSVDTHYDSIVVDAITTALRELGAKVDVIITDAGPDREFDETDEIKVIMRKRHWKEEPRRYEGIPWIEQVVDKKSYNLLIQGVGGPVSEVACRSEGIPWLSRETLGSDGAVFPVEVNNVINERAWAVMWGRGRGGRVRLTDPEGTDITFTLWDEYYDGTRPLFNERPVLGHLMGHPDPPILPKADARGIIAGTTSHYSRPFPQIKVHIAKGLVTRIEGGGRYGDAWRGFLEETKDQHYPEYPRPGLFWLWELAIGTNPKVSRPSGFLNLSSGGSEFERFRSGVIHAGFGTSWRMPSEEWAVRGGILYGHLHVHLLFPTYEITAKDGEKITIVNKGHLAALDDSAVIKAASKHGDPKKLLDEDWIPAIPGINVAGDYWKDYGTDPLPWIRKELQILKATTRGGVLSESVIPSTAQIASNGLSGFERWIPGSYFSNCAFHA